MGEDVEASTLRSQTAFCSFICRYLEMASLSLYLLNMLPLPYLDGMELAKCLLEAMREKRVVDELG